MIYTLDDLRAQIDPDDFDRGWLWFSDGEITAPNVQRGGEIVTAVVRQPGREPLRVYVVVRGDGGAPVIHGECTCPARRNCGHVAAALLQALEDQGLSPRGIDRPVANPPGAHPDARQHVETPGDQVLLYLLDASRDLTLVEARVARRRDDGSFVLGRKFAASAISRRAPPRFLAAEDLELLSRLEYQPPCPGLGTGSRVLEGPGAGPLLQALLATGRCRWANAGELVALAHGEPRTWVIGWEADRYTRQRPVIEITPAAALLLVSGGCWYFDVDAGTVGRLEPAMPPELADELLEMPPAAPDEARAVHQRLTAAWPDAPVPAPRWFDVETLPPARPVPCLRLVSDDSDDELEAGDYARLSFDYDGVVLDWRGPDIRFIDGRAVRVPRDGRAEEAAVARLEAAGLEVFGGWYEDDDASADFAPVVAAELEPDAWLDFQIEHVPELEAQGWRIVTDGFRWRMRQPTRWICDVRTGDARDWFDVALGVEVEGEHIDLLPILVEALRHHPRGVNSVREAEQMVMGMTADDALPALLCLPTARIAPLLEALLELYGSAEAVQPDALSMSRVQLARLAALEPQAGDEGGGFAWLGDPEAASLIERLQNLDGIEPVAAPAGLAAELRPYQQRGLDWLQFLRAYRFGGILADDMGLGKTLQALAHLLVEKAAGRADRPSLVVAPTSLMFNWRDEARRFAPSLEVVVLHGPDRRRRVAAAAHADLVLTTYPLLARDREVLAAQPWHLLILDEAQVIRNPKSQAARVVRMLETRHPLCLTGTPMENHLGDLWALFDVLLPGLLGDARQFRRAFRTPIEKHGNEAAAEHLRRRIRPFLLRRTKGEVAAELPEKTEIVHRVGLEGRQRELYETVRLAMHQRVRDEIERQGLARSQIVVLDALLKLRQVCCDPRLMKGDRAVGSAKLEALMELLPEMVAEGRRILLFSQFTTMLGLIEAAVGRAGIDYVKLTGRSRDRRAPVERFQRGDVPLFLISLKAGGVGLNLTAADTVIHYDPWWNPAVERQATDRAHRLGQRDKVFVYKLLCEGTVEEKIHALQARKQALADGLYGNGGSSEPQWSEDDLAELFRPMAPAS